MRRSTQYGGLPRRRVEDNEVLLYPELMDSASLFLTPNSDTVYFWSFVDLRHGPMVTDVPVMPERSGILGTIDEMWFRWVTDWGRSGVFMPVGAHHFVPRPPYKQGVTGSSPVPPIA